ncbi:MAG: PAQR family membrane homeostasis protein TrhA, partial [Dongiaceae bacterium]
MRTRPSTSRSRDPEQFADGCVHYVSIAAGLAGGIDIVLAAARRGDSRLLTGVAIYAAALLFLAVASAVNNMAGPSPRRSLLRRLDHAAIFLMIAGTYTPFVLRMGGAWGNGLLLVVWLGALAGIVLLLLDWRRFDRISTALYL